MQHPARTATPTDPHAFISHASSYGWGRPPATPLISTNWGVLFDFDGTIRDTHGPWFEAWRPIYRRHGLDLTPQLWDDGSPLHETDPAELLEKLVVQQGGNLDRSIEELTKEATNAAVPRLRETGCLPGVIDLMQRAHAAGCYVGIVTNGSRKWLDAWLPEEVRRYVGDRITTSDDVGRGQKKPSPEPYLRAAKLAEQAGVQASRLVAVEDSACGAHSAWSAGLPVLYRPLGMTAHQVPEHPHLRVRTLHDLPLSTFQRLLSGRNLDARGGQHRSSGLSSTPNLSRTAGRSLVLTH